jgi:hypothetical protein
LTPKLSSNFWLLTDCESCSEGSDFEEYFGEEEEAVQEEEQQQQQASAEIETQAATSLPNWGPPQRRNTILLSVQQKA